MWGQGRCGCHFGPDGPTSDPDRTSEGPSLVKSAMQCTAWHSQTHLGLGLHHHFTCVTPQAQRTGPAEWGGGGEGVKKGSNTRGFFSSKKKSWCVQ